MFFAATAWFCRKQTKSHFAFSHISVSTTIMFCDNTAPTRRVCSLRVQKACGHRLDKHRPSRALFLCPLHEQLTIAVCLNEHIALRPCNLLRWLPVLQHNRQDCTDGPVMALACTLQHHTGTVQWLTLFLFMFSYTVDRCRVQESAVFSSSSRYFRRQCTLSTKISADTCDRVGCHDQSARLLQYYRIILSNQSNQMKSNLFCNTKKYKIQ